MQFSTSYCAIFSACWCALLKSPVVAGKETIDKSAPKAEVGKFVDVTYFWELLRFYLCNTHTCRFLLLFRSTFGLLRRFM